MNARPLRSSTCCSCGAFGAHVDKSLFALKGGCNLRFFLKSIRYSENIDLGSFDETENKVR